jgi:polyisoprenoid-binding protein YceI
MKTLLLSLLMISAHAYSDCTIDTQSLKVEFVAFKTPLKVGVKGWFTDLGVKKVYKAKNFAGLFENRSFSINPKSIKTGNESRDMKIAKFFFGNMEKGNRLKGKLLKYGKKELDIEFDINGVNKVVPLKMTRSTNTFEAKGVIDVFDFSLMNSLKGINKACEELHEGKTWNDVEIYLKGKFSC